MPTITAANQVPPFPDVDWLTVDASLRYWLDRFAPVRDSDVEKFLTTTAETTGSGAAQALADRANRNPPQLATYDRWGNRVDDVAFDPAWHELLDTVLESGLCGMPWTRPDSGYVVRGAAFEMWSRVDAGLMCPISMTTAAAPVFLANDGEDSEWFRRLAHRDPAPATAGMAMTEPQGGSDLSQSSTVATPCSDGSFRLDGHKWFCSHPTSDVLLVLAREPGAGDGSRGLSCFVVPHDRPDGTRNGVELQRLKDKLGTHSLASAEVLLRDAWARRIGEPGKGVPTIIAMVAHTRMDCVVGSAGGMAKAVFQAVHHCNGRETFAARLSEQPLMRSVLADLALEREGALAAAFETCRAFDAGDPLSRLSTAVLKYWVTRRAVAVCVEAVETLGGNGYTETFPLARLYRDAQVNSTWEGSGNVMVLDTYRSIARAPELLGLLRERIEELTSEGPVGRELAPRILAPLDDMGRYVDPAHGRRAVGLMAVALQAALLASRADGAGGVPADAGDAVVARAFVRTRVDDATAGHVFGSADPAALGEAAEVLLPRYTITA